MAKRKNKKLDAEITRLYHLHSAGQINIMDIGKVFAAGEQAAAAGNDIEAAVKAACEKYTRAA